MSYRNPGNIPIADPNAFLNTFLSGVEKYRDYYSKKAEERKKKKQQDELSVVNFRKQINYPELLKQYGQKRTDAIRSYINTNFIDNKKYQSASETEKQDIIENLQIDFFGNLQKSETAFQLDPTDINLESYFDTSDPQSQKFISFLQNKANGGAAFEIRDNKIGYTYKDESGNDQYITSDEIPDKIPELKTDTQLYTSIEGKLEDSIGEIDSAYMKSELMGDIEGDLDKEISFIYSSMDEQEKAAYFKKALANYDVDEDSVAYNDFPDNASDDEISELKEQRDNLILADLKETIRSGSREYQRFKNKKFEEETKDLSDQEKIIKAAVDRPLIDSLRLLKQKATNNGYKVVTEQGVIKLFTQEVDEESGEVIDVLQEQINANDKYALEIFNNRLTMGSTMQGRLIEDELTRLQIANRGNVNVTLTEQQTEFVAAVEGFTTGTEYVDSPSFNIGGKTYKLNTTLDNILDEEEIKNYIQNIGINQTIPNALKSKGYPVTKENINVVRQIIKLKELANKNVRQIIDLIPQATKKQLGTDVNASGEINKDFA